MLRMSRTLQTLMLLMALAVITQRVLTPFVVPPLLVHADGTLEICSWQGGSQRLLLNSQGERIESLQPDFTCPDCASSPALSQDSFKLVQDEPHCEGTPTTTASAVQPTDYLHPPSRAPPV